MLCLDSKMRLAHLKWKKQDSMRSLFQKYYKGEIIPKTMTDTTEAKPVESVNRMRKTDMFSAGQAQFGSYVENQEAFEASQAHSGSNDSPAPGSSDDPAPEPADS